MASETHAEYSFVIVGSGSVGKSAITVRFIQGSFVERYDPTIEDCYLKQVDVDGVPCVLDIMDTAGQENYKALRDSYMKKGQGFLLVFAVTTPISFTAAQNIHKEILRIKEGQPDIPIVLVANKIDQENEREVKKAEAEGWARQVGIGYMETSAKTNTNINEAFFTLVRMTNAWREKHPATPLAPIKKKAGFRCSLF